MKNITLSEARLCELQKLAETYCYLKHDDTPTISTGGIEFLINEALKPIEDLDKKKDPPTSIKTHYKWKTINITTR